MRSPVCWNSPADRLVLPLSVLPIGDKSRAAVELLGATALARTDCARLIVGGVGNISHAEIMRQAQIDFGFGWRAADPLPLTMIVDAVARA